MYDGVDFFHLILAVEIQKRLQENTTKLLTNIKKFVADLKALKNFTRYEKEFPAAKIDHFALNLHQKYLAPDLNKSPKWEIESQDLLITDFNEYDIFLYLGSSHQICTFLWPGREVS